jgi:hypothetical protein
MRRNLLVSILGATVLAVAASGILANGPFFRDPAPAGPASAPDAPDPLAFLETLAPLRFKDAAGDATDIGAGDAGTLAACTVGRALTGQCLQPPARPPAVGTPGPHFDILQVSLEGETRDDVVVSLQIAPLSEGYPELRDPDGFTRLIYYQVCWSATEQGSCNRQVVLHVLTHDGTAHTKSAFEIRSRACNEWSWCSWEAPLEVTFGSPATLTWRVPKIYLAADGGQASLARIEGQTGWISHPEVFPAWHPGVTVHTAAYHFHTHGTGVTGINIADVTEPFKAGVALTAPPEARYPDAHEQPLLWGGEGANHGASSPYNYPELDLLWFDLHEDQDDLVAVFAVKELRSVPSFDFDYSVGIGIGNRVWEVGWRNEASSDPYGYAGRCIMEPCQDGEFMHPKVELTFGAPGYIAIRTPLEFLYNPEPGTATNLFWAMSMYSDVNYYWGDHGSDFYGDYHSVFEIDSLRGGGLPYVFGSGHRADPAKADAAHHH